MNESIMTSLVKEKKLSFIQDCKDITEIHKGYSNDKKFKVTSNDGQRYLLKLFDSSEINVKQAEIQVLKRMCEYEVNCSRPIEIGKLESLDKGYMLLSFIEGLDGERGLPRLSEEEQFRVGIDAGRELLKMHQFKAPSHISPWYDRKVMKHKKYIEEYLRSDVKLEQDWKIINFIENNIGLMKNRPNIFQHDDFHTGNIVVNGGEFAGVIDFNRYDWGDPIHEFLKVGMFSRRSSIAFSIGQIKGYHHEKEPDELFWHLYSLYLAMAMISSVVWILKVKPKELNDMLTILNTVLEDHDYFEKMKPEWYVTG